jgi:hypothetical protein
MDKRVLDNVEVMFKGFEAKSKVKKVTMERMGSLSIDSEVEEEKMPLPAMLE